MRIPRGHALAPGRSADPIRWRHPGEPIALDLDRTLALVFADAPRSARLRSWDHRTADGRTLYWIAARGPVGMHADPGFGRWQHQLVIRNDGYAVVGFGRELPPEPFRPGDLYLLDAHSPHALIRDPRAGPGGFFVAAGFDGDPLGPDEARPILDAFARMGRRHP